MQERDTYNEGRAVEIRRVDTNTLKPTPIPEESNILLALTDMGEAGGPAHMYNVRFGFQFSVSTFSSIEHGHL